MDDSVLPLSSSLANAIKVDPDGAMKVKAPANPFLKKSGVEVKRKKKKAKTVTQRVDRIGGDYAKFNEKIVSLKNEQETFFAETLLKWNFRDLGQDFRNFLKELPLTDMSTYAQVLYYHKRIFTAIIEHLRVPNTTAVQPLLDLALALAKDLKEEFYEHMWPLFNEIIIIMGKLDVGFEDVLVLKAAYFCVTLLFKQHWRKLIRELRKTFMRFVTLFAHRVPNVRRLIAEAFSVLVRKSSSITRFLAFVLERASLLEESDREFMIDGLGQLLFNTYKGLNGMLHGGTTQFLTEFVNTVLAIQDEKVRDMGVEVLEKACELTMEYALKNQVNVVADVLLKALRSRTSMDGVHDVLRILMVVVTTVQQVQLKKITKFTQEDELLTIIEEWPSKPWFSVTQELVPMLGILFTEVIKTKTFGVRMNVFMDKIHKSDSPDLIVELLTQLHGVHDFSLFMMPVVGKLAKRVLEGKDEPLKRRTLSLYGKLISHRRPVTEALERASRTAIFDVSGHTATREYVLKCLKTLKCPVAEEDEIFYSNLLLTWPFLYQSQEKVTGIDSVRVYLHKMMTAECPSDRTAALTHTQLSYFAAAAIYQVDKSVLGKMPADVETDFAIRFKEADYALMVYLVFLNSRTGKKDVKALDRIISIMMESFSSPYAAVRRTVLKICSTFSVPLVGDGEEDQYGVPMPDPENMFEILLQAELVPHDPYTYKERTRRFRMLNYGGHRRCMPAGVDQDKYEEVILRVVLSQWYEQFVPIWKDILETLATFASGMDTDIFWKIYNERMQYAFQGIRNNLVLSMHSKLAELLQEDTSCRTDYGLYLLNSIKFLEKIPHISEECTKDLSPMFIDFFDNEYLKAEAPLAIRDKELKRTIEQQERELAKEKEGEDEQEEDEGEEKEAGHDKTQTKKDLSAVKKDAIEEEEGDEQREKSKVYVLVKRKANNILMAFLNVYSNFEDMNKVHMQPKIFLLINELLMSNDGEIARVATKCLFNYHFMWLTPYKETFQALLDESKLTSEITKFAFGSKSCVIAPEHRQDLVPVLLRMLYGRFVTRSKKARQYVKRAIMRFLYTCTSKEIDNFLRSLFLYVLKLTDGEPMPVEKLDKIAHTAEFRGRVVLTSFSHAINNFSEIFRSISRIIDEEQILYLYKLIINMCAILTALLHDEFEHKKNYVIFNYHRFAFGILSTFVRTYSHIPWTADMCGELYKLLAMNTKIIEQNGRTLTSVSVSVLPVLSGIGSKPKMQHILTGKICVQGVWTYPMKIFIDSVLCSVNESAVDKIMKQTRQEIMKMLEYADEEPVHVADIEYMEIERPPRANLGTSLLISQMDCMVEYLATVLENISDYEFTLLDIGMLTLLHRMAPFVDRTGMETRFANILLRILKKSVTHRKSAEMFSSVMRSLALILKVVDQPIKFYQYLPKLSVIFEDRTVRDAFGEVSLALSKNPKTPAKDVDLLECLSELDAWNPMDEDDHDLRAKAFAKLSQRWITSTEAINLNLFAAIVCAQEKIMLNIDDLGMRSLASSNLRDMVEYMPKAGYTKQQINFVIEKVFLKGFVKRGFASEDQNVRDEFVRVLHQITVSIAGHPTVDQLALLRHGAKDKDFWLNIVSIQKHHRQVAMDFHAERLINGEISIDVQVLFEFIVPILRFYMFDIEDSLSNISDSALRLYKFVMERLPFRDYLPTLDESVKRLTDENYSERAVVRELCTIIDAFHFDFTEGVGEDMDTEEMERKKIFGSGPASTRRVPERKAKGKEMERTDADDVKSSSEDEEDGEEIDSEKVEDITEEVDGREKAEENVDAVVIALPSEYDAPEFREYVQWGTEVDPPVPFYEEPEPGTAMGPFLLNKVVSLILPQIKQILYVEIGIVHRHKKAKNGKTKFAEADAQQRRCPIVLAGVKLLLKLPKQYLDENLRGFVYHLVKLLISHSDSLRIEARKVTVQVLECLGSRYLPYVILEMKRVMTRGAQMHYLIFSTHTFIEHMRDRLSPGDLDICLPILMNLIAEDLFYVAAEQKTMDKFKANHLEANADVSLRMAFNVGSFIGINSLRVCLRALQTAVDRKPIKDVILMVGQVLDEIANGMKENNGLDPAKVLIYCHQLLEEHVEKMSNVQKLNEKPTMELKPGERPPSCFLLPPEPRRLGERSKLSQKSRSHIFVEYALTVVDNLLECKKLSDESQSDVARLDPFVPVIARCLTLKYERVILKSLCCVYDMLNFPLPSLHDNTKSLVERLFVILCDYGAMGFAGDRDTVVDLTRKVFMTFDRLIHTCEGVVDLFDKKQLELLINYIEVDILDMHKRTSAFVLLNTIILKRIEHPRIPEAMTLLREQAITTTSKEMAEMCRETMSHFVCEQHPQARHPGKEVEWWLDQLEYEVDLGRMSAAEMLNTLYENCLQPVLEKVCIMSTVKLGARLVNDDSPQCRQFAAHALRTLLSGVGEGLRNDVFTAVTDWLSGEHEGFYTVASGVLVQLAAAEEDKFAPRLVPAFELLRSILEKPSAMDLLSEQTINAILDSFTKILRFADMKDKAVQDQVRKLLGSLGRYARCVQTMSDVRLATACLYGQIFSMVDQEWMSYLVSPSPMDIVEWTVFQLRGTDISDALAEQAIKNLVYLLSILEEDNWKDAIEKCRGAVRYEVKKRQSQYIRRTSLFKMCAALAIQNKGNEKKINILIEEFFPLITRELMRKSAEHTETLYNLAKEVGEVWKMVMGERVYSEKLAETTKKINEMARERQIDRKQMKVMDPVRMIQESREIHKRKRSKKLRELDELKPHRKGKRARMQKLRLQDNEV